MATVEDVVEALKSRGMHAWTIDVKMDDGPSVWGINVYAVGTEFGRYADDTVYPPLANDGWVWGGRFQHNAPADASADDVAQHVIATVKKRNV